MSDDNSDASKQINLQENSKRMRTRIGPKKAARIAAGEDRKKGGKSSLAAEDRKKSSKKGQTRTDKTARVSKSAQKGIASRKLALETLLKIEKDGAYANLCLKAAFEKSALSEQDRAFVTALVQGVLRNQSMIDHELTKVSKEPLAKMPSLLRNLLRMAVFQLSNMSETPEHAVLDTSNQLARALGHEGLVRYTNGVLRGYLRGRQAEDNKGFEIDIDDANSLGIKYSLPVWLIERWKAYYGKKVMLDLLEWSKKEPPLTVRVSEVNVEPQTMLDIMNKNGFAARAGHLVSACLVFEGANEGKSFRGSPSKMPGFEDGFFVVQDEAAAFVTLVLSPQKGETVVDLCAAPGGKTIHIAEILENTGRVIAVDKHESRLKLVKDARLKQGLKNLETVTADGRQFKLERQADRVLVDAPCSGTGVINRRTDIRTNREPADIGALTEIQKALLDNAASLVKPGGILVYSTCSLEPEENIGVIEWFLSTHPEFKGSSLLPFVPERLHAEWFCDESEKSLPAVSSESAAQSGHIQLIPTVHGVAGFFICRLQKES
jgi:16S rRNA (cytosine967-C5)-methyltransferase